MVVRQTEDVAGGGDGDAPFHGQLPFCANSISAMQKKASSESS